MARYDGGEPGGYPGQLPGPGQEPLPRQPLPGRLHDGQFVHRHRWASLLEKVLERALNAEMIFLNASAFEDLQIAAAVNNFL